MFHSHDLTELEATAQIFLGSSTKDSDPISKWVPKELTKRPEQGGPFLFSTGEDLNPLTL